MQKSRGANFPPLPFLYIPQQPNEKYGVGRSPQQEERGLDGESNHIGVKEGQWRHACNTNSRKKQQQQLLYRVKETKTSSSDAYRVAEKHMMLTARDNKPAALTLWPVSRVARKHCRVGVTILLITPKKSNDSECVSGDTSNTKSQPGAEQCLCEENREGVWGGGGEIILIQHL